MRNSEVIIIGGGLAGLTAAIDLRFRKIPVTVFEKEPYPRHKVCGEYVSNEILPYFQKLEIPIKELNPPGITRMQFSTYKGKSLEVPLPLGGMGISRFAFDDLLYKKAVETGAEVIMSEVKSVEFSGKQDEFEVITSDNAKYVAKFVLGAFGKRSGIEAKIGRTSFQKKAPWLAIKSHYKKDDFPADLVALHNFKGGYCGISKTESNAVNVCYLATYKSFKKHKDPGIFLEKVLRKNPLLDQFFANAVPVFKKPLTIAQVSFEDKKIIEDHIVMIGDAAGLLHPLCGNGMAIAVHSGKIVSETISEHLQSPVFRRNIMEADYKNRWNRIFRKRFRAGKWLQSILLNEHLAETSQGIISKFPFLLPGIIRQTHGKPI